MKFYDVTTDEFCTVSLFKHPTYFYVAYYNMRKWWFLTRARLITRALKSCNYGTVVHIFGNEYGLDIYRRLHNIAPGQRIRR